MLKSIRFFLFLWLWAALGILPSFTDTPAALPPTITLTILHTNDMHGHMLPEVDKSVAPAPQQVGGAAYMAGLIEKYRAQSKNPLLLIDSGDIAQGTPVSNTFHGRPMVEFMNDMDYDAGTIGNHEFDWGPQVLQAMIDLAKRPIVCANLVMKATGQPPPHVRRFIVKEMGGVKIGITGLVTSTTPTISFARNMAPYKFLDETACMRELIPEMHQAGAQVILVTTHIGEDADKRLAAAVPGIDVIIGGHSHTAIFNPDFVNGTVIVQAGKYMRYLGHLNVTIDTRTWKVVSYTEKNELTTVLDADIQPDARVEALVDSYNDKVAPMYDKVIGQADTDLNRVYSGDHTDTSMGDVLTDAWRWKTKSDVAVYNSGGIRADLNKGPIKLADVFSVLPFEDYVITLHLTGAQILRLLAQGIGNGHKTLQVSGMTFRIGPDLKPQDVKVAGQPIDPARVYSISTVDYLAQGGDGLTVFKESPPNENGLLARDVFADYVRSHSPLWAAPSGRITRVSP